MVWQYECLPKTGVCVIDRNRIALAITFTAAEIPDVDVLQLEKQVDYILKRAATVESYAKCFATAFPDFDVCVVGQTDTHGPITVRLTR